MAFVVNQLRDGSGRGMQDVTVRIQLIAPHNPFLLTGIGEVIQAVAVDTDHTGIWTAELTGNDQMEQANTYYLVDETAAPGGSKWAIRVPTDTLTHQMRDLLVYVPPGSNGAGPTVPGGTFEFVQSAAANEWVIPHQLGYRPVIEALEGLSEGSNSDGLEWSTRRDPDVYTTVLTWGSPVAGRAYCS